MEPRSALSDIISTSPLALVEQHVKLCAKCVAKLADYFEAAQADKWTKAEQIHAEIVRLESEADELKLEVRRNLPRRFWTSMSRVDLLELIRMQDKMANDTQDATGLSLGRELAFPAALEKGLRKYIKTVIESADAAVEVILAMRELSQSAFGARQARNIMNKAILVEKLERKTDKAQARLRARLRSHEEKLSPVDAIFLYQLLAQIGLIADRAEKVAHRAQIIAAS
jgi:predicted phosphate transport protein (TIGR00153 family)